MTDNTMQFNHKSFAEHPKPGIGEKPIVKRKCGSHHNVVTFYPTVVSLSICKSVKGQRIKEVIGHWPYMSILDYEKIANERISNIELGYYNKASKILVGDFFIDSVLPMMEMHNRDIESVKTRWRRISGDIADKYLCDITRFSIMKILTKLSSEVKGATVNRHLSLLSRICSIAVEFDLLLKNPCKGIKKWPESNLRDRVMDNTELYSYIDKALEIDSFHSKSLLLSLFMGLRIGNVIDIHRGMINSDFSILSIPQTKNGRAYRVAINDPAKKILIDCAEASWNQWLFPSAVKEGNHIAYPTNCHAKIRKYVAFKSGISEHLVIHDLRRTYASRQLQLTGDARLVQQNLFHQSITTTEHYAFHDQKHLTKASQDTAFSIVAGHNKTFNLT